MGRVAVGFGVAAMFVAAGAGAQVQQPTGEVMPQPTPRLEIDLVVARGFPASSITLAGLFAFRGENIDPVADAELGRSPAPPRCGLRAELLLRGGSCELDLGWYNAAPNAAPPAQTEVYPLVPGAAAALACSSADFCPLAADAQTGSIVPGIYTWVPQVFDLGDLHADPRYRGGAIGFALLGRPGSYCPQTKYSDPALAVRSLSGVPWVTVLTYTSTATPNAFYLAFEDLPNAPATWKGAGTLLNDGDFNDQVFLITETPCAGEGGTGGDAGSSASGSGGAAGSGSPTSGSGGVSPNAGAPPASGGRGAPRPADEPGSAGADEPGSAGAGDPGSAGAGGTTSAGTDGAGALGEAKHTSSGCTISPEHDGPFRVLLSLAAALCLLGARRQRRIRH